MPRKTASRDQAHLVTDARQSRSADIAGRERRYLVTMGVRLACFALTGILVMERAGWIALIPAIGAIFLPYFAVVIANAGRGGQRPSGFRPYEPALPGPAAGAIKPPVTVPPADQPAPPADQPAPPADQPMPPADAPGAGPRGTDPAR